MSLARLPKLQAGISSTIRSIQWNQNCHRHNTRRNIAGQSIAVVYAKLSDELYIALASHNRQSYPMRCSKDTFATRFRATVLHDRLKFLEVGVDRFLQRDYVSSLRILVIQVEALLREMFSEGRRRMPGT
jgi:hypothetical protein